MLQDVLLRIHKNVRHLSDDSRFGPWVYSVARNAVVDRLRKKQLRLGDIDLDSLAASTDEDDEQVLLGCVTAFVARLPEAYRHAITLVELQGLSQAEAAAIAGISLSGMKSRVQRGRRMLREMFEECCLLTIDARGRVIEAVRHAQPTCGPSCAETREGADDAKPALRRLRSTGHAPAISPRSVPFSSPINYRPTISVLTSELRWWRGRRDG